MKTIQITLEDELLSDLDKFLNGRSRARSAFIRDSVAAQLRREKIKLMDQQEEEGYRRYPMTDDEMISPENEYWGEDEDFSDWEKTVEPR